MSTFTITGRVTFAGGGNGINGVTVTVTRVSGTADASSPYVFTTAGSGPTAGDYTGGTLVTGTTYSVVASDGGLVFSTLPNIVVATTNITGQNFTLTPTISVNPTSFAVSGPAGQEEQLHSTVGNDVAGTTTWSSSAPAVATVNSSGLVTILTAGTATITAAVTDDTAITTPCAVTVGNTSVVYLTPASNNLLQNLIQAQLQAGYAANPFTAAQSAELLTALAALRNNV